jgi:RimJ/RimL family protein N-acetyltransferase
MVTLEGPRLRLRPWRLPEDLPGLHAINGDPEAMRHLPAVMDRAQSDAWAGRLAGHFAEHGWGFWVVETAAAPVAGVVGLMHIPWQAPFTPAVEIGWRIATRFQRQGLAEEAARLALAFGLGPLGLDRVVAFTAPANVPSWRLMERLGMRHAGDFAHPRLAAGHLLRMQRWYEVTRAGWMAQRLGR